MKRYSSLPEATAAALVEGWLATGDIGKVDEHGHLFIVDEK
jgi:long-chain acyl-CoA synthetase